MTKDPKALYDETASRWARKGPSSLSDFTGRPAVFELLGSVKDETVLDAGCGEGYCSRVLADQGPKKLVGIDVSAQMVELAQAREAELEQGITFQTGDVRALPFDDDHFDAAIAVFVFNYLDLDDTVRGLSELRRVIRPGGRLVFSIPHPAFGLLRGNEPPFYFDLGETGYFSGRNVRHRGEIWRTDGTALEVQMVHKTFEDFFEALHRAGFTRLPRLRELKVLDEHVQSDPEFFGPIRDVPLHVAFAIEV